MIPFPTAFYHVILLAESIPGKQERGGRETGDEGDGFGGIQFQISHGFHCCTSEAEMGKG